MKILTIVSNAVPNFMGGELRVALDLSKGYIDHGHECEILTFGRSTENMPERYEVENISVKKISTPSDHIDYDYFSVRTLPTLIFQSQVKNISSIFSTFDIIHIHNLHSIRLVRDIVKAREISNKPIVWTTHDYWFCCPKSTLIDNHGNYCNDLKCFDKCFRNKDFIHKYSINRKKHTELLKQIDIIIPPSKYMKDRLIDYGFDERKIQAIYNGIPDIKKIKEFSRNYRDLLYIGTPWPHKGVNILLCALKQLIKKDNQFTLHILGNYDQTPLILDMIKKLNIDKNVILHGRVSKREKEDWLFKAGILILPSTWPENCSIVLLEGLRAGIPIITSRMGGNPEIITEDKSGIVLQINDEMSIANAVLRIVKDLEFTNKLENESRKTYLDWFTSNKMVDNYLNTITKFMS